MLNFRALKISRKRNKFVCALFAELSGQDMRALSSDTTANLKISNPSKSFDHLLHLKSGVRPPPPVRAYFLALEAPVIGLFCNLLFQQTFVGGGFRSEPKERLYVRPCFKGFRPREFAQFSKWYNTARGKKRCAKICCRVKQAHGRYSAQLLR